MEWLTLIFGGLKTLTGFGDTVKSVSDDIANWQIKKLESGTDQLKIDADAEIEALKLRRDVLLNEVPGSRVNQLVRVILSMPAIILIWKIEVWDRVLNWGSTPKLSTEEWAYIGTVTGFYLLNRVIQIARK